MKKSYFFKFFVFALVGALAILPSCKDYDDDISGLQNQIDQLASKTELTTQLGTLQSSLATAQTAATTAATKADQALTAANAAKAAADAAGDAALTEAAVKALAKAEADAAAAALKVDVLAELQAEIDALKAELEATNEAEFNAIQEELNKSLAEIAKNVEAATGLIAGAIFDVELISSYTGFAWEAGLLFSSATEKANVFSQGVSNAITFVKDNQVQTGTSLVIRVSPTNVIVTPEMISFQNSLGVAYDNLKVTKVEPYEELLTRSTNGGGLWKVYVELNNYDEDAFEAATQNKDGDDVLFAVALSNVEADAPSKVISAYDLGLYWEEYTPANGLDFTVNKKPVAEINNRATNSSISLGNTGTGTVYEEKVWLNDPDVAAKTNPANTTVGDNRSLESVYPAVQGQPLKIELNDPLNQIRAMYVTLDFEANAIDSAPSEWNAWNGYSYTGLGTVVEGTTAEIIINNTSAINDIIGFRVFAVNFDGTLVDPDGKAFYVSLGKEATSWNALSTVATATDAADADATNSASVNATLTKLTGATDYEWTTDEADNVAKTEPAFDVVFTDANNAIVFGTNGTGAIAADFSKVTKAYTVATDASWLSYKDNKEYKGKLAIKNATGHVLATLDVTYKKVLPTAPEGFSVKTNQIAADGIYYSYLEPNNWAAPTATAGTMPLSQVYNFGAGTETSYETTFAASAGTDPLTDVVVTGGNTLSVAKSFVDNTTKHATKVVYNFGQISTETKNSAGAVIDYKVTVKEFQTVYSNIYNHTYSWRWATKADLGLNADDDVLPYSTSIEYGDTISFDLAHIYGVSDRDSKYNAFLDAPYLSSLQVVSAKLVSNANNLDEYFVVTPDPLAGATVFTLTEKSGSTNPTANVPSTLVLKAKDMYDNDVEIRLPMTVLKR